MAYPTYTGTPSYTWSGSIPANGATPMQTPVQQPASNGGFMTIFVNSEDEVTNYPVAAGLTVLLVSFDLKKFWLKGTDTSGIPKPLRIFEFEEKTPAENQNGSYVTKKEFDEVSRKLDKLLAELGGVKNE